MEAGFANRNELSGHGGIGRLEVKIHTFPYLMMSSNADNRRGPCARSRSSCWQSGLSVYCRLE